MKILFKKPLQLFALGVSLSLMTTTARSETLADALVSAYNHSGLLEQNRALLRAADARASRPPAQHCCQS